MLLPCCYGITPQAAGLSSDARSAYEGYLCSVKRMGGRVAASVETSFAQWQQYVICTVQAVARRSRAASTKPMALTLIRAARRVNAFFVSQKVNGRNAP